jgi:hypothetical protein
VVGIKTAARKRNWVLWGAAIHPNGTARARSPRAAGRSCSCREVASDRLGRTRSEPGPEARGRLRGSRAPASRRTGGHPSRLRPLGLVPLCPPLRISPGFMVRLLPGFMVRLLEDQSASWAQVAAAAVSSANIGLDTPVTSTVASTPCNTLTSRHLLLSWESPAEFEVLLVDLLEEHQPGGATERHLVMEIAAVMWRQRRVLQAEVAEIRDELRELLGDWLGGEDRRCGSRPHRPEGQGRRRKRHPEDRGPDAGRAASARTSPAIARRS